MFFVLWIVTISRFDYAGFASQEIESMWQSLGSEFLRNDPWGSLMVLHTQPPGLNVLFALDLAITPDRHVVLATIYLAMVLATIAMIVDIALRFGVPVVGAATAGVVYALLPATVIYSLWAYSVAPIAFYLALTLWPLSWMSRRPVVAAVVSTSAMLLLVLTRPSFPWPVLVVWALAVGALAWRVMRRGSGVSWRISLVLIPVVLGLLVQLHYFLSFGLPVMSSWSGENLAKALRASQVLNVTDSAREQIETDLCRGAMLQAYEEDRLNRWDDAAFRGLIECSARPVLEPRGVPAFDSPVKPGSGVANFNYADRLVASREWTAMMNVIVREDPWQLVRMAVTTEYGPRSSSLGLYLSPAEDYPFVTVIRDASPLAVPTGLLSLAFAPGAWVMMLLGAVHAIAVRGSPLRRSAVFWGALGLAAFHLVMNTLFEYSENMRYQAEIAPVLMIGGTLALWAIWRGPGRKQANTESAYAAA